MLVIRTREFRKTEDDTLMSKEELRIKMGL
jgi:hypothetical protein